MAFALLKNRFKEADKDGKGTITKEAFKKVLENVVLDQRIPPAELQLVLKEIGKNDVLTFKQYLYSMYLFVTNV